MKAFRDIGENVENVEIATFTLLSFRVRKKRSLITVIVAHVTFLSPARISPRFAIAGNQLNGTRRKNIAEISLIALAVISAERA